MSIDLSIQDIERVKQVTQCSFETIQNHINKISRYQKLLSDMNQHVQNCSIFDVNSASLIVNTFLMGQHVRLAQSAIYKLHHSFSFEDEQTFKAQEVIQMIKKGELLDQNNICLTLILEQFDNLSAQILFSIDSLTKLVIQKSETAAQIIKTESSTDGIIIRAETPAVQEVVMQAEQNNTATFYNLRQQSPSFNLNQQYEAIQQTMETQFKPHLSLKRRLRSTKAIQEMTMTYGKLKDFTLDLLSYEHANSNTPCLLCKRIDPGLEPIYMVPETFEKIDFNPIHLPCLLYNNFIYLNHSSEIRKNDLKFVDTFLKRTCRLCNELGASIKCYSRECNKYYHFPCFMLDDSCGGIPQKYSIICPKHLLRSRKPACLILSKKYKERQNIKRMTKIEHQKEDQLQKQLNFNLHDPTTSFNKRLTSQRVELQDNLNNTKFKLQVTQ